ncbi:MAG: alpha/beta hydrolase [Chitinophagales bacterium]
MKNIVLFPGLAADERLFASLNLEPFAVQAIHWLKPEKTESLQQYARRIAATIEPREETIFIGVSFGGLLAQEVAQFYAVEKIILISSLSSANQLPAALSFFRIFPVYRWVGENQLKNLVVWMGKKYTKKNEMESIIFQSMVQEADIHLVRWGISQTLHWKQSAPLFNIIHIHGTGDRLFPSAHIPVDYTIYGGQHFMVLQEGAVISALLKKLL